MELIYEPMTLYHAWCGIGLVACAAIYFATYLIARFLWLHRLKEPTPTLNADGEK